MIRETGGDFNLSELLRELEQEMQEASANLEFERAALLRDQIMEVKSGSGLAKIEPKRRPIKYTRNAGRRRSRCRWRRCPQRVGSAVCRLSDAADSRRV